MKNSCGLLFVCGLLLVGGCANALNPTQPASEAEVLTDLVQLTDGFDRAGEAYFSPDMHWIIFQAATRPGEDYQMYVAKLKWSVSAPASQPSSHPSGLPGPYVTGIERPIRITPVPSWNSCGFFSPDSQSLIFASTALHPKPKEAAGGYQRNQGTYKWSMPDTAQIFRADGWKPAVAAAKDGAVNLAQHAITPPDAYHAECAYSPDGKWIVYTGTVAGDPELFVMRADGSNPTRLTYTPGYDGGPFFSPDGKRLVYRSDRKKNDLLQVFVADLVFDAQRNITGLANEKQLTNEQENNEIAATFAKSGQGGAPVPSHGELLRPTTGPSTNSTRGATTNPSGGSAHSGAQAAEGDYRVVNWGPFWHPDGKHIVYASSLCGHWNYEIFMMRDDGSHKTRITNTPGADVLPVFSPDGKWMMWTSKRVTKTSQIWVARFTMPRGS